MGAGLDSLDGLDGLDDLDSALGDSAPILRVFPIFLQRYATKLLKLVSLAKKM